MKTNQKMTILALITLATCASAQASVTSMVGTWNGTGQVYALDGTSQGSYAVQLIDTLQNDGSIESKVDVAIPGAPNKQFDMVLRDTGKGFTMNSTDGSGGFTCLEKGLCEGYYGDAQGNGVAMTLIVDSPNSFRSLKTELQGFKAVRLFLEKYTRAQTN